MKEIYEFYEENNILKNSGYSLLHPLTIINIEENYWRNLIEQSKKNVTKI